MYKFRQYYIPDRMMDGIERWVNHGIVPGGFLTAIISNNLSEAMGRADDENMANVPAYVSYFHNECPAACWGSVEKMQAWSKRFTDEIV